MNLVCSFCQYKGLRSARGMSKHLREHEARGEGVRLRKSVAGSHGVLFMDWEIVVPPDYLRRYEIGGWERVSR